MEIGLALPQYDYSVPGESPLPWETLTWWADRAVSLGFSSLWLSDHLFLSLDKYGGPATRYGCFDPITGLGALALRHPDVTLGCLVFCAQLRPPALLAKQLETLDGLARGTLVAGMGAGWYEPEFEAAGVAFGPPGARLAQLVDAATRVGEFLTDRRVPIWFGGKGDRLIELAARHADGWNTVWAWTPDVYEVKARAARQHCERAGRDPVAFTLSVGLTTLVGENEADVERRWARRVATAPGGMLDGSDLATWRADRLVGTVEQVRDQRERWKALGVGHLIVNLGAVPFSVRDTDDLDLVASALI